MRRWSEASYWGDDEGFTDEQLRAVDAIEASYYTSYYSRSSSSRTPNVPSWNHRHGRQDLTADRSWNYLHDRESPTAERSWNHIHSRENLTAERYWNYPHGRDNVTAERSWVNIHAPQNLTEDRSWNHRHGHENLTAERYGNHFHRPQNLTEERSWNHRHGHENLTAERYGNHLHRPQNLTEERSATHRHVHENLTETRRRLPRSIASPSHSQRFPLSRCQADSERFPAMRFAGKILYCKKACEVDNSVKQLLKFLDTKRDQTGRAVIGLDVEWKPSFKKGVQPGKVAVMQICADNQYCRVLHIIHSGIPESLRCLLEDSTIVKVGVGIDSDSVKLFHDYGVSIKDAEDLSDLAKSKLSGDIKKWGLASLTERLLSKQLLKPKKIRLGNWEVKALTKEQLKYAATDAFASWQLHQVLKDLPDSEDKEQ